MPVHTLSRQDMKQQIEHQASRLLRGDPEFNDKIRQFAVSLQKATETQLRKAHNIVAKASYEELLSALGE